MPKALNHILIWTAYFGYVSVTEYILSGFRFDFQAGVLTYLSHNVLLFYALLYCYRKFRSQGARQLVPSLLRFAAAILLFLGCRYLVGDRLLPVITEPGQYIPTGLEWWTLSALWITRYAVIALAYHFFSSYRQKLRENKDLAEEKQRHTQQQLVLENQLLRAQIDPHFLYNALNALYAKALPVSRDLGEAILKLADIMRYAINPNPVARTVPLTDELNHIRNIVDIARYRFNGKLALQLCIEGDFSRVQVVPLAFITLSENVLKHANLADPETPGKIRLQWLNESVLAFSTWNKKRISREFPSNGIGLNNTIQRLQDHYGDACTISIEDCVDHFHLMVLLEIDPPIPNRPGIFGNKFGAGGKNPAH